MKGVTKLVANTPGIADGFVYISVRMAVYPIFDTTVGNEVAKFRGEGPVYRATLELVCHKFKRRHMMGGDYMMCLA